MIRRIRCRCPGRIGHVDFFLHDEGTGPAGPGQDQISILVGYGTNLNARVCRALESDRIRKRTCKRDVVCGAGSSLRVFAVSVTNVPLVKDSAR